MSEPEAKKEAAPGGGGASKAPLIAIVVSVLNLGATGFVANKVVHAAAHPPAEAAGGDHGKPVPAPINHPTVQFEAFVVNLNEPGANRYLKASFDCEVENDKVVEELNFKKKVIRDDVLRFLSSLPVSATQGEAGKTKIGEEILARVNRVIGADKARHVYFNDFVIQ